MPNVRYRYAINQEQDEERGWLTSGAVRTWWLGYSWWVIPLGFLLLVLPWLIMAGVFESHPRSYGGNVWTPVRTTQSAPAPRRSNQGQVNVTVPDNINITVRQAPSASGQGSQPSAEQRANQFWEQRLNRAP